MAVEKMNLLSIVGKGDSLNSFICKYLLKSGLQPEDALKAFEKGWKLSCYDYDTWPRDTKKQCKELMEKLNIKTRQTNDKNEIKHSQEQIEEKLKELEEKFESSKNKIEESEENIKKLEEIAYPVSKLKELKVDLGELYNLKYIRYRYGRMPKDYYEKTKSEIWKKDAILFKVNEEDNFVWLIYFTIKDDITRVDSYFNVMKFERIWLPDEFAGIPEEVSEKINTVIEENKKIIKQEQEKQEKIKDEHDEALKDIYNEIITYENINNIKRYIVHDQKDNFYLIGWIPSSELETMLPKLNEEKDIEYKIRNHDEIEGEPPTHLKNNKLVAYFESIVKMYGLPNYKETDPTPLVAITAFIMYGLMFGDIGQGLIIALAGIFMWKKKSSLGPVLTAGGISAMIFGCLYGSIFGKEGIIPALLISPMENITTMLIAGIGFGVILIIIAMLINIKNGIKNKDIKKAFLDQNGLAGIAFYGLIIGSVVYFFIKGKMLISMGILTTILIALLLIIALKDKIASAIENKKEEAEGSVVEKVFEIIEMLLSMVSNTVSFVRLAAFAINHVGLCTAVYILSNMASGAGNIAIAIIGNILVIGLEGLIVGIQVLRLEYYELFSRFYEGNGKEYRPIKSEIAD